MCILILRASHAKHCTANQPYNRGSLPIPHRPILMPISPAALVTFVQALSVAPSSRVVGKAATAPAA
jgi:hypothetical protein